LANRDIRLIFVKHKKKNKMKKAILVKITLMTRVIIDELHTTEELMELAIPKLSENLMDNPFESIDEIVDDTECPYEIGEEFGLSIGVEVEVPDPIDDDLYNHNFVGTIVGFKDIYAVVEDGDGDCFDIEMERLIKL